MLYLLSKLFLTSVRQPLEKSDKSVFFWWGADAVGPRLGVAVI